MKNVILILFIAFISLVQAQQIELSKAKPFVFPTEIQAIGKGTKTTKYVIIKDTKYFLYQGAKGGLYYTTKNNKGEWLRKYVPKR